MEEGEEEKKGKGGRENCVYLSTNFFAKQKPLKNDGFFAQTFFLKESLLSLKRSQLTSNRHLRYRSDI